MVANLYDRFEKGAFVFMFALWSSGLGFGAAELQGLGPLGFFLLGAVFFTISGFGFLAFINILELRLRGIASAPGATAVTVLQFLLPRSAFDDVFSQVIADMREEYFAALAEKNTAKANWILVRDNANLFLVVVQYLIAAFIDRGMKLYRTFGS